MLEFYIILCTTPFWTQSLLEDSKYFFWIHIYFGKYYMEINEVY